MSYTTLSTQEKQKNHYLKKFLNKTIFYSVHPFAHIRQHYFSRYWGDQCMGRPPPQIWGTVPTSNLGGTVPPVPPRSPPLLHGLYYSEALPTIQHGYCFGFSRRSAQTIAGKGLAQGPYVAARARVESTTIRLKVIVSTKAPPRPISRVVCASALSRVKVIPRSFATNRIVNTQLAIIGL